MNDSGLKVAELKRTTYSVLRQVRMGYAVLDADGTVVGASPDLCTLLDFRRGDLIGKPLAKLVSSAAGEEIDAAIENLIAGAQESYVQEITVRGRPDRHFLLQLLLRQATQKSTSVNGFLASIGDITPMKQAEASLRDSEELFRSVFQNSLLGFYRTTPEGEILRANPALCEMLRYDSLADLKKLNLETQEYTALCRRELFKQQMEDHGVVVGFETTWQRADGTTLFVRENARAVRDETGNIIYYDGTVEDITERKAAEEALRESEERLRQAMQAGRMYAFEWDAATDRVVRSGDRDILGNLDASPEDTGEHFMMNVHPDDRDRFHRVACEVSAERPLYQITYRVVRDGRIHWIEERGRGFFDEHANIQRVIGVAADVTQRKQDEETLRELGGRLLRAQEDERGRIARELHDDIGQELALLEIRIQTGAKANDFESAAKWNSLRKHVEDIGKKVRALSHELHSDELEYLGLAVAVEGLGRTISENYKIEVSCECSGVSRSLPPNFALCFYRLVQESLQNVVRHSGAQEVQVKLNLSSGGAELLASITDSGSGFDPQNPSCHEGLGLISMRERMHSIGGELTILSKPGEGTTVSARAPLPRT